MGNYIIGAGLPIIIQAFINIGVALNILPVTGQTLPLLSSGGSAACNMHIGIPMLEARFNQGNIKKYESVSNPLLIISEEK